MTMPAFAKSGARAKMIHVDDPRWYTSGRFQRAAVVLLLAFALGEGVVGIFLKDNDFAVHRYFGEGFLQGDPYPDMVVPYLTTRAMINALTAWLPYRVDRALVYL